MVNAKEDMQVFMLTENSYSDLFLQAIIYHILTNKAISKRVDFLSEVLDFVSKASNEIMPRTIKKNNIFQDFANCILSIGQRNEKRVNVSIHELLNQQMLEPIYQKTVHENFDCKGRFICEIDGKKDLINIILEGKREKYERFNERFSQCAALCMVLNISAGRQLSADYLQHMKVVYREIIEDGLKYNGTNAHTMVKKVVNSTGVATFNSIKESMFIREKISRGLFRECNLIDEYILKNKIQSIYYNTLLEIYDKEIIYGIKDSFIMYLKKITDMMIGLLYKIDEYQ
ncbi:hypothetical protein [Desulfosporosinus metallidurans]|nr:hypothetical protein [Desulfosporosinus metallidurans]